jgi:hypothetical protein
MLHRITLVVLSTLLWADAANAIKFRNIRGQAEAKLMNNIVNNITTQLFSRLGLLGLVLSLVASTCLLSACAVVSVAGAAVGAAVSVTGAVVSTGVSVTGKVIEKTVDAVTPDSKKEEEKK